MRWALGVERWALGDGATGENPAQAIDSVCHDQMMSATQRRNIVSGMGSFYVSISIESLARRSERRTLDHVLVDTGSELTWVPASLLEELGVEPEGVQRFIIADGRVLERRLGMAIVHAEEARAPDWVVFAEEGDMTLLGARSLEGMNLRVDPRAKRLVPAGPIVTAAA